MSAPDAERFDLSVIVLPQFVARESTIWPAINKLEATVDELVSAEDALIARLATKRESL